MPSKLITVVLMPGEHFAGDERHRIRTLLGSCVSIILWHPKRRIGAMSHFVLAGHSARKSDTLNGRYGEDALELMMRDLEALGVSATECQAKVFGGSAMFDPSCAAKLPDVGRKNGEAAKRLLLVYRIPIISESLFDAGHRNIAFDVKTGEVWVRHAKLAAGATQEVA